MPKEKQPKVEPKKALCPGLTAINGLEWNGNPPHETNASFIVHRLKICVWCVGTVTSMSRWYGIERDRPLWRDDENL